MPPAAPVEPAPPGAPDAAITPRFKTPPRMMIFQPNAQVVYEDEAGALLLAVNGAEKNLTVRAPDGEVTFTGSEGGFNRWR